MKSFRIFLLLVIVTALFAAACSRARKGDVALETEEFIIDELTAEEKEKIFETSGIKQNRHLAENLARIEISRDNFGIRVEKQFYKNLPNLKYISVHTFPNGQKQIIIYGENGTIKSLSDTSLNWLATATPDELTKDTITFKEQERQTSPGITITTLPPITTAPAQPVPTREIEKPQQPANTNQQTEIKTQEPAEKKDSTN